jgi:hypothetical protein
MLPRLEAEEAAEKQNRRAVLKKAYASAMSKANMSSA